MLRRKMIQITPNQITTLRHWFNPERRHLIGLHVLNTGNGACFVDRWPEPQAVLVLIGTLGSLTGDPAALKTDELTEYPIRMLHTSSQFVPLLKTCFTDVRAVDRVVLEQEEDSRLTVPSDVTLRRLGEADAYHLSRLPPDLSWISNTWGGPAGMASSGFAWGAFIDGRLVSLAGTFLVGDGLEDIGVVTEADYRGRGLAALCAAALCQDVQGRGRRASWTTSNDNPASIRVAGKLGFAVHGPDVLYILGQPVPQRQD
jgi:RimJ/RimL family protein N-acetyltransferase